MLDGVRIAEIIKNILRIRHSLRVNNLAVSCLVPVVRCLAVHAGAEGVLVLAGPSGRDRQ